MCSTCPPKTLPKPQIIQPLQYPSHQLLLQLYSTVSERPQPLFPLSPSPIVRYPPIGATTQSARYYTQVVIPRLPGPEIELL
ncbi:hypothetical protein AG1IA_00167 [Rhizoctonia solani AG-1 IA]|uniref:Uncharacterized protein n=1 Tax=Thanatephorus cucumeris (strain AG1-IA) TaxID=983506 RepID=L8XAW1_THACA|nr:hypothetical protein AG1IA_00167 [Rhizoctonia solani AG-1 IA]